MANQSAARQDGFEWMSDLGLVEVPTAELSGVMGGMSQKCTTHGDGSKTCLVSADNGQVYVVEWDANGHAIH